MKIQLVILFNINFFSSMREAQNCSMDAIDHGDLNIIDYKEIFVDLSSVNPNQSISDNVNQPSSSSSSSPYRKYIEHVLKSRGLGQALSFLHRLHNTLLRKAHATLDVPGAEESDSDFDGFHEELQATEIPLSKEQEDELHRYGCWSDEAISLNLPSYVSAFVFLSFMPLEVMNEYLRMRLESKPITPNPLSLEQLMKELREGLILAMTHRERYSKHIHTAFYDKETELEKHAIVLEHYDATVKNVLDVSKYINSQFDVYFNCDMIENEYFFNGVVSLQLYLEYVEVSKINLKFDFYCLMSKLIKFLINLSNGYWLLPPKVIEKMHWTKSGCFQN